jgi:hypothetical protein
MPISPSDCWMKVDHSEMSSPQGAGSSLSENRVPPVPGLKPASSSRAAALALS